MLRSTTPVTLKLLKLYVGPRVGAAAEQADNA
jgi:hypothetical protein